MSFFKVARTKSRRLEAMVVNFVSVWRGSFFANRMIFKITMWQCSDNSSRWSGTYRMTGESLLSIRWSSYDNILIIILIPVNSSSWFSLDRMTGASLLSTLLPVSVWSPWPPCIVLQTIDVEKHSASLPVYEILSICHVWQWRILSGMEYEIFSIHLKILKKSSFPPESSGRV